MNYPNNYIVQKYKKFLIQEFTNFSTQIPQSSVFIFHNHRKNFPTIVGFLYDNLADLRLAGSVPSRLARLCKNNPEAFYYWVRTSELLSVL